MSAIFTTIVFFAGQLTKWVVDLGSMYRLTHPWVEKLLHLCYLFMPNLHNFNIRREAVLATQDRLHMAVPPGELLACTTYGLAYTVALLLAANLLFSRRNL